MSLEVKQLTVHDKKAKTASNTTTQEILHETTTTTTTTTNDKNNNNNANNQSNNNTNNNNKLDFIATSKSIKTIFSLPYQKEHTTSIAIHNIGNGTLVLEATSADDTTNSDELLDDNDNDVVVNNGVVVGDTANILENGRLLLKVDDTKEETLVNVPGHTTKNVLNLLEEHEDLLVSDRCTTPEDGKIDTGIVTTLANTTFPLMIESGEKQKELQPHPPIDEEEMEETSVMEGQLQLQPPEYYASNAGINAPSTPRQYLPWKFHDMSLVVASDALLYRNNTTTTSSPENNTALVVRVADANVMKHHTMMYQRHYCNSTMNSLPSYADVVTSSNKIPKPNNVMMELQTCVIPPTNPTTSFINDFYWNHNNNSHQNNIPQPNANNEASISSTICTCLDAYLDTIMTNVPQLALCLEEKGYIQSVKLLQSQDIPTQFFSPSSEKTSEQTKPFIFQPNVVDLNATILLRFLKENCTSENSTYLLHHTPGSQQVQLYDVTSISQHRQRKWIWWLATISYRFAIRLTRLSKECGGVSLQQRKHFRDRTRNLLRTTLDLLMELSDMDEDTTSADDNANTHLGRYETIRATVYELLADTFLQSTTISPQTPTPSTSTTTNTLSSDLWLCKSSQPQPYENLTVDGLTKAQDYLLQAIKTLKPFLLLLNTNESQKEIIQSIQMQLFGLHHKAVNVCLRLASHHLRNYWSSSVMQSLRISANTLSDSLSFRLFSSPENSNSDKYLIGLLYQYAWIWEYCGHFARSFAATDDLWRERGYACGDDVISLLQEVEDVFFSSSQKNEMEGIMKDFGISSVLPITLKTNGRLSLRTLQPLVVLEKDNEDSALFDGDGDLMEAAEHVLDNQKSRITDKWRVLVSSALCYSRAIEAFDILWNMKHNTTNESHQDDSTTNDNKETPHDNTKESIIISILRKRLGDACNEIGKILLSLVKEILQQSNNNTSDKNNKDNNDANTKSSSIIFLLSAQFWFEEGLHNFEICNDVRNIALLRCNLCQCCKIRANSFLVYKTKSHGPERFLQDAANHLQLAHIALHTRDTVDTKTWDMVSEELAATFLILGVRRRQMVLGGGASTPSIIQVIDVVHNPNNTSINNRLTPGKERSIIEPISQAISIYTTLNNTHQVAAAHYQLALFYSKIWTCQRDEKLSRVKLSFALKHFQSAHAYFITNCIGMDGALTFVILCLDLSNLYSAVIFSSSHPSSPQDNAFTHSPNAASLDCTIQALNCCIDTLQAFSPDSIQCTTTRTNNRKYRDEWYTKMSTLATNVEERIFKLLLHLVKIEKDLPKQQLKRSDVNGGSRFKTLYRIALDAKREQGILDTKKKKEVDHFNDDLDFPVYGLLTIIKEYSNRNKMQ